MENQDIFSRNVAVIGTGPFGLFLLSTVKETSHRLVFFNSSAKKASLLDQTRKGQVINTELRVPDKTEITSSLNFLKKGSWTVFLVVSSKLMETILEDIIETLDKEHKHLIVAFSKGFVSRPRRRRSGVFTFYEYARHICSEKEWNHIEYAVVGGGNLLGELELDHHSFFTIGSTRESTAAFIAEMMQSDHHHFRYTDKITALEVVSCLKNPIAVACGIISELPNCGDNVQGELIRVGTMEILKFLGHIGIDTRTGVDMSLADVVVTSISHYGRNRSFGQKFIRKLVSEEKAPSLFRRIEIMMNPQSYIEKEISHDEVLVDGAFILTPLLEIAEERKIDLPFYNSLYRVLSRQESPAELIRAITRAENYDLPNIQKTTRKKAGLTRTSGQNFQNLIVRKVITRLEQDADLEDRIIRQAPSMVRNIMDRLKEARRKKDEIDLLFLPTELKHWENIASISSSQSKPDLEPLVEFYSNEMSDTLIQSLRTTFLNVLGPTRFLLSGFTGLAPVGGDLKRIRALAKHYDILYTPTHRSHLDSIELAFGLRAADLPIPRYAADKKVMGNPGFMKVLKSLGAYMVDRKRNRNILYLEVLTQYSTVMLEAGIPTLVYPEGTRSRTGGIAPIKTGILSTSVEAFRNTGRDVLIIPVSLSYESVPEDQEFCGGKEEISIQEFFWHRKPVHIEICEPIPVSNYVHEEDPTLSLANEIVRSWERRHRILPSQILCRLLMENGYEIDERDFPELVTEFIEAHHGNYLTQEPKVIWKKGMEILEHKKMVQKDENLLKGVKERLIDYYASMIPRATGEV